MVLKYSKAGFLAGIYYADCENCCIWQNLVWRLGKPYAIMILVENLFGNMVSSCTAVGSELNADNMPGVSIYNMIVH